MEYVLCAIGLLVHTTCIHSDKQWFGYLLEAGVADG